ncbi:MAG: hypothetical protein M3N59_01995 [bacterium]|nr:hypothetical protein [bacterium]
MEHTARTVTARTVAVVALAAAVAAGGWLWMESERRAADTRDASRRTAVEQLKRTLDAREGNLPKADGSLDRTEATGGLAELAEPPIPSAESDAIRYAVDDAGREYMVCTELEDGSAYYATGQGTFAGPAVSCAESADPAAVGYVLKARMTQAGADRYLGTRPRLVSKPFIQRECSSAVDEGQLQGCYTGDHIYLIDLPQQEIRPELSVTAAHEMLHAVWQHLSDSEQKRLTPLIEAAVRTDRDLAERAESYEDDERTNEMHSILGTEVRDPGPELRRHYAWFLKDRGVIVGRHLAYERTLDDLKAEIDALKAELDRLGAQADALLAAGDVSGYNALVDPYNALVAEANEQVRRYNELTSHTRPDDRERTVEGR